MTPLLLAVLLTLRGLGVPFEVQSLSVSAYADYGITASGAITREGGAACGPSFAFGTAFIVNGQTYVCTDRGGLVTDGHVDLFMADKDAAWEWGRRQLPVIIVEGR
jgi:3D (Asp-Asp-Asp) domain-containing protein